jgi:hypothetical protein
MNVKSLSLSEAEEMVLSKRKDQISLRGKQILNIPVTGGMGSLALLSSSFGTRVSAILAFFARWKIMRLVIKPITNTGSPITSEVVGLQDDPSLVPSSFTQNEILELRCSRLLSSSGTDTDEFQWNPIDSNYWFSTNSSGDVRLNTPAAMLVNLSPTSVSIAPFVVYYSILAEGAYDNVS